MTHLPHLFIFLLLGAVTLVPVASASVFDDVRSAVADAIGGDDEAAGYLLGLVAVVVILLVIGLLFPDPRVVLIAGLVGLAFVTLIGWWPTWTMILLVIGLAVLLFRLPGLGGDGGT